MLLHDYINFQAMNMQVQSVVLFSEFVPFRVKRLLYLENRLLKFLEHTGC